MRGSHDAKGCSVGQKPGQPIGLPGAAVARNERAVVFASAARRCSHPRSACNASAPVAPDGLMTGPKRSDVPAPDSNARLFIGCFEYS